MSDLFVHVRMKDCCRKTLGEIDGIKKGIGGTGAFKINLAKILGDKTIPEALSALATTVGKSAPEGDKRFTSLKKKSCSKAASTHASAHRGKAETTEASFWEALSAVFEGKDVANAAASAVKAGNGAAKAAAGAGTSAESQPASSTSAATPTGQPYQDLVAFSQARGFVVTSTTGGTHNSGSAHYQGRAIDVRTNDHESAAIDTFIQEARGQGITVRDERTHPPGQKVWTGPHLHLELPAGVRLP